MIATYIQELLATNNRVIIPNYGAFLVRATSKSKDANTLNEKLKDIYFSPFLKFNDELLEKYIIKKESITKEQSAKKIVLFIDDIKKVLDEEKPFEIKDFGKFVADKQGKVQFITATKEEPEAVKEEKASEMTAKKTPETTKKEEVRTTKVEEVKKEPQPEVVKPYVRETVRPTTGTGGLGEQKATQTRASVAQTKSAYGKKEKSANKGLIWSIAIGLPLVAVFIWGLLNFDTVKKTYEKSRAKTEKIGKEKKTTVDTKKETETIPTQDEIKQKTEQAKPAPAKVAVQEPIIPQKKYYIIAGSFKNERYAISYLNKLKAQGYRAEKLAPRNGMHAVSFNSFADKRKAIAEYKYIAQEKGLQTWILYY